MEGVFKSISSSDLRSRLNEKILLLVSGFIRDITKQVPDDIIVLCRHFYGNGHPFAILKVRDIINSSMQSTLKVGPKYKADIATFQVLLE